MRNIKVSVQFVILYADFLFKELKNSIFLHIKYRKIIRKKERYMSNKKKVLNSTERNKLLRQVRTALDDTENIKKEIFAILEKKFLTETFYEYSIYGSHAKYHNLADAKSMYNAIRTNGLANICISDNMRNIENEVEVITKSVIAKRRDNISNQYSAYDMTRTGKSSHIIKVRNYIKQLFASSAIHKKIKLEIMDYLNHDGLIAILAKREDMCDLGRILEVKEKFKEGIPKDFTSLFPQARLMKRHFIIHVGGTNTGKTYTAVKEMMEAESGIYLAPLRLLAMENQDKLNSMNVPCSLSTGEEEDFIEGATHISCTVEKMNVTNTYKVGVIDECQLLGDSQRGWAWTNAVLGLCAERIHVCTAASGKDILIKLIKQCGDSYEIVEHKRNTKLIFEEKPFVFQKYNIQNKDAYIVFSRKKVLQVAADLEDMGIKASVIYGALPFRVRKNEVEKYLTGKTKVVVATDAIGLGMNLPIRRIVFLEQSKFDGKKVRPLTSQEIKQIAGRAGRYKMFNEGFVNCVGDKSFFKENLECVDENVAYAGIQLPQFLTDMDMPLSDIIKEWDNIPDEDVYKKTDNTHNLMLAEMMERNYKLPKKDMYRFIHIPFDEDNEELLSSFKILLSDYERKNYTGYGVIEPEEFEKQIENSDLNTLEQEHKVQDLLFSFYNCVGKKEYLPIISKNRELICDAIIKQLINSGRTPCP